MFIIAEYSYLKMLLGFISEIPHMVVEDTVVLLPCVFLSLKAYFGLDLNASLILLYFVSRVF